MRHVSHRNVLSALNVSQQAHSPRPHVAEIATICIICKIYYWSLDFVVVNSKQQNIQNTTGFVILYVGIVYMYVICNPIIDIAARMSRIPGHTRM